MGPTTTTTVGSMRDRRPPRRRAVSHDRGRWRRRATSVTAVVVLAIGLTVSLPLWLPIVVLVDLVRARWRFPLARLMAFGVCYAWLETAGVAITLWYSLIGRGHDVERHYALQRWWAKSLVTSLRACTGARIEAEGVEALTPGPVVVLGRHASLADSLVSAYVIGTLAGMDPRYVLKRELLVDPCLDIVGQRLPNHFLDRGALDSAPELAALSLLTSDLGERDCAVIFPEGTRANPKKRASALDKIRRSDPERADRLSHLDVLIPPRPAGAQAMLAGHPTADVVLCWHIGFDGLDTFGGILRHLSRPIPPVRFVVRRVSRETLPPIDDTSAFTRWLDDRWCELDAEAHAALGG
jgi:1-acyl-sn-glycerol-3-phosphate acyltransferase